MQAADQESTVRTNGSIGQPITYEKIPTHIYEDSRAASQAVAHEIADLIREKQRDNKPCVLGLATGSSPKTVYAELVRMHREEGLSFRNVVSFNLDEYYPMEPDSIYSYHRFMKEQLFDLVDIPKENYFLPDGTIPPAQIKEHCRAYENMITQAGGLDFQLLGIGGNGHVGFNEPGSLINARTRLIALDHSTRAAAAMEFGGLSQVPRKAITMGIAPIMSAKRIVLLAWGERKAPVLRGAVEGPVTERNPASYLQAHPNVTFVIDERAASELTRMKTPWAVDSVVWDNKMVKKAVTYLSQAMDKPILKLTDKDYNDNGMSDLLAQSGAGYEINIDIFNQLQHTITGWPGGKPDADDTNRPERKNPARKRIILFSPHPDDDIISMGGTFQRLVDQNHEVHVAYQTSGNIAVADDEALRFIDFVVDFNKRFSIENTNITNKIFHDAKEFLKTKKDSEMDTPEVRHVKGLIRRGEAKATCRFVGVPDAQVHFLDLPFYESGTVQKKPLGEEDIVIIEDLIKEIKPHQIYAAGDFADPHGTHKVCWDAIEAAIGRLKHKNFMKDCWVWLYRGAWAEWDIHEIEMAVPMSPDQVLKKRMGIFKHQSQKDGVVFQGDDSREFWQRAEERNQGTAQLYDQLGLAEYEAMEAFVRWRF
ncbi:glucosamine-6-phosphate deaminase [Persicitalea jodogahamensis]|uniref:Glucosamine-6-phosphate deaminase n=1 Tax=Persicitalea jodogahamensis TaxID=402147 RepID=A0A8J3GD42_9BACT|nr:glucosamine-6-phosphate deaminase [Persicitalea jodogahamensis]GHB88447.1 glucosamine-6-phosphate deaminase [Persicitalea jodogahamensis]